MCAEISEVAEHGASHRQSLALAFVHCDVSAKSEIMVHSQRILKWASQVSKQKNRTTQP